MLNLHDHSPKFVYRMIKNFKICMRNHQKIKVHVWIHQDNFFDKRSMQKWRQHDKMAECCNFRQFWVIEDYLKLFCDVFH